MMSLIEKSCPCGTGLSTDVCCGRYHDGAPAPTPEALMRSRYSAFALNLCDYVLATWHVSTRPEALSPDLNTEWKALIIVKAASEETPPDADKGYIHFRAYFKERGRWHMLEENSRFVFEQSRWWYVDGTPEVVRLKPRRNDPCFCGSGRKLKLCCKE